MGKFKKIFRTFGWNTTLTAFEYPIIPDVKLQSLAKLVKIGSPLELLCKSTISKAIIIKAISILFFVHSLAKTFSQL